MSHPVGFLLVGRSNIAKRSEALERVAQVFEAEGTAFCWFKSERIRIAEQINARIDRLLPAATAGAGHDVPLARRILRYLLKGVLILGAKERWMFIEALYLSPSSRAARELDRFVDQLPYRKVHIITHSAGGIAATKIARNPKVLSICCFGYPFRHSDHPPEAYRTRHLAKVVKPFLIMQGTSDEYGAPSPELAALLPPHAEIIAIDCGHDTAGIRDADFEALLDTIRRFVAGASA